MSVSILFQPTTMNPLVRLAQLEEADELTPSITKARSQIMGWLVKVLDHGNPKVRVAVARILVRFEWEEKICQHHIR
jgi:hypothetical protein